MAIVAGIAAIDVARILSGRSRVVVATDAAADDLRVVDLSNRREVDDRVAVLSLIRIGDFRRRVECRS